MRIRTNWPRVSGMTSGGDIAMALRTAYLALHRRSDAAFAPLGITADQFVLLAALVRGDAMTQRELAKRMSSDPSTVRAMIVLLEGRGFVEREAHPTDSRARTVAVTAEGRRVFRKLWAAGDQVRDRITGSLQPGEAESLVRMLRGIAESLNPAAPEDE